MTTPNGHDSEAQILVAADQIIWVQALETHLANTGYNYTVAHSQSEALKVIEGQCIGAVIAICGTGTITFLDALRSKSTSTFLILVVPDELSALINDHVLSLVDAVLPSSPYLETQLQILLKQYFDNQELKSRIGTLEQEIEEQKRLTNEMEILKNAIVRNVSHELRTPLLQVKSAVSLIKEEVDQEKLISYAENATARLEVHVNNITMLGHSLDLNPGPIILRDAVEYARRNLGRVWQRKSEADRITLELEANLPPVVADKQGLSMVMQLLMDNALKFSEDKVITVMAHKQDRDSVYIAVRDEGIGIAKDKLQHIFDTFYQVDNSSTRRYGGAGVGLALVKLILDHHNTTIHVESDIDKGSIFWFTLPSVDINGNTLHDEEEGAIS